MGLDGPYIQTAGTSPFLAWSCVLLSLALFLNSNLQFAHLLQDVPLCRPLAHLDSILACVHMQTGRRHCGRD